jgi:Na+-translocating ferredoxin:NAD+ oxidoreductase RnfA subunit
MLISTAIGFGLALVLFAGIREQLGMTKIPKGLNGTTHFADYCRIAGYGFYGFCRYCKIRRLIYIKKVRIDISIRTFLCLTK